MSTQNLTAEKIDEIEEIIKQSGNSALLDLVKQNQDIFEISNILLFRSIAAAAQNMEDVFLISTHNGVLFLLEREYIKVLENSEENIKTQIMLKFPDFTPEQLSEEYDNYVAGITLKHIDHREARRYSDKILEEKTSATTNENTTQE